MNTDLRLKSYFGVQSHLRVLATEQGYSVSFFIEDKNVNKAKSPEPILEKQLL